MSLDNLAVPTGIPLWAEGSPGHAVILATSARKYPGRWS